MSEKKLKIKLFIKLNAHTCEYGYEYAYLRLSTPNGSVTITWSALNVVPSEHLIITFPGSCSK